MLMCHLLLGAVLAAGADFEAQTLGGQSTVGQIAELNGTLVVLKTADGPATLPLASLVGLSPRTAPATDGHKATLWVELVDQSGLAAADFAVGATTARITLLSGTVVEIPTPAIRWVRFAPTGGDDKLARQWSDITETKTADDLLVVRQAGGLDYLEGVQKDVDAETCKFEVDKEAVTVKRPKVEGIVFAHSAAAELPEAVGQLITADGSRLAMRTVELAGNEIKIATPSKLSLSMPLDDVVRFDFSSGKVAYLSEMAVESSSFVPLLGFKEQPPALAEFYQFRRDIGFEQNPLQLDGKTYRKGLALQTRSVLVYKLPSKFRLFKTVAGIDDSAREAGNVHLEIKGDGKTLWQGEVRGSEPPRELELDIAGVKRLEIVADYGADLDIGDRLDLCDARVTK